MKMSSRQIAIGLVLYIVVAVASPKGASGQFFGPYRRVQPYRENGGPSARESITNANSQAVSQGVDFGEFVGVSHGLSSSKTLTETDGGHRNGGTTNGAESNAYSENFNVGRLGVSSTIAQRKSYNNGQVSHSLGHNLNVGQLGVGTSLSRDNLNRGLGLQVGRNGGASLGLGLLNIDLSHNSGAVGKTEATAGVDAVGSNVQTDANSRSHSQREKVGLIGLTSSQSEANAVGVAKNGHTSGYAAGVAAGAVSQTQSRRPEGVVPRFNLREQFLYNQPLFFSDDSDELDYNRLKRQQRRQFQRLGFQQPNFFGQNSNADAFANSNNPFFEQQSGANTQSQNLFNQFGQFQQNSGSSIASNIAKDGSAGQLSASNTAQQSSQTANGSQNQNAAQSQALNFDKNSQQAAASNADTSHIREGNNERLQSNSGSMVQTQDQLGSSANTANSNTVVFNEGNRQGSESNANSQSVFQGAPGSGNFQGSNSGANSQSSRGPNGFVSNSASSHASSSSQGNQRGGGAASASASSASGTGPNGSFTNAEGLAGTGGGGGETAALSQSGAGFNQFGGNQAFANGQAEFGRRRRYRG